jgi:hypothetical protein
MRYVRSSEKTLLNSRSTLHQLSRTRRKLGASASRLMLEDRLRCALRPPVARQFKKETLEELLLPSSQCSCRRPFYFLRICRQKSEPTRGLEPLTSSPATSEQSGVSGCCRGLHGLANPAYLGRFLFCGLPSVAGCCAPGGVRVVSTGADFAGFRTSDAGAPRPPCSSSRTLSHSGIREET